MGTRQLSWLMGGMLGLAIVLGGIQFLSPTTPSAYQIANGIRCPICPEPLSVNQVQNTTSDEIRLQVAHFVAQGWSEKQIDAHYVAAYGPGILLTPAAGPLSAVAWGVPFLAFFAALALGMRIIYRWSRQRANPSDSMPSTPIPTGDLAVFAQRVERELHLGEDARP